MAVARADEKNTAQAMLVPKRREHNRDLRGSPASASRCLVLCLTLERASACVKHPLHRHTTEKWVLETAKSVLLKLDGGAGTLKGSLCLLGVVLRNLLEDWLWSSVNEVLGFLEAE